MKHQCSPIVLSESTDYAEFKMLIIKSPIFSNSDTMSI